MFAYTSFCKFLGCRENKSQNYIFLSLLKLLFLSDDGYASRFSHLKCLHMSLILIEALGH
jgi:hypothetical protein